MSQHSEHLQTSSNDVGGGGGSGTTNQRSTSPRPPNALRNPAEPENDSTRPSIQLHRGSVPNISTVNEPSNADGATTTANNSTSATKFSPRSLKWPTGTIENGVDSGTAKTPSHVRVRKAMSSALPSSRAATYHAGTATQDAVERNASHEGITFSNHGLSDIERQSVGTGNSSDVVLQGRSYRFHPASSDIHHAPLVSPYTATSHTIRDSTAALADMALRSEEGDEDDDRDAENDDALAAGQYDIEEVSDEDASPPMPPSISNSDSRHDVQSFSSQNHPSTSTQTLHHHQSSGPSNLSRTMLNLHHANENALSTSPSEEDGPEQNTFAESTERTPLIGQRRQSRVRASSANSKQRSQSRSKSPGGIDAGQSGISNFSNQSDVGRATDAAQKASSTYGYGALAQASSGFSRYASFANGDQPHVSFADAYNGADDYEEEADNSESGLSPAWALIPPTLRPGSGSIAVRSLSLTSAARRLAAHAHKLTWRDVVSASAEPIRVLPAVILGMLLNVLDGVSYGLIIFPTSYPIFSDFGGDGVSMFFVTCIISQLIYTLGGSVFKGGNGSMMIEVVPFYHILVTIVINTLGDQDPAAVVSTIMVAYALSSIFAGVVFLLLGYFRLGVLIGFFPRHILVGCIGGVGVFLIETGLEVAGQLKSEEGFQWNLDTLHYFTQSWFMVAHWLPPLALAILLRLITAKFHHPLVFPAYFLVIPVIFYIIAVGFVGAPIATLRKNDWIFDVGKAAKAPFWRFYTYFDFRKTSLEALWATMPTQLALTFFSILHVPLNVPALAVSVNEDNLDTDRELLAHGFSNIAAGLAGSVPNYLCYVNSVLFYRVGGGSRLSGLMLAAGTFILFLCGPGAIGYLPIMMVGSLIFVLGIDLTKEAVWDTIGRVNAWEYFTIWVIIFVMTYYDFVVGILSGVIVACLFFVIQTSRRRTVRAVLDGTVARSTVRRHTTQRQFLAQAGKQTQIVKLQGFLYFANISSVETLIRRALDIAAWQANPIRFLLIDFSLVYGVDFSAAEALTRIQRLLQAKDVVFVFCGLTPDSDVGVALRSVDLWTDASERLEVFQNLNEALEWTENEYLRSMYSSALAPPTKQSMHQGQRAALNVPESRRKPAFNLNETPENSPRRRHLFEAARNAVSRAASGNQMAHRLSRSSHVQNDEESTAKQNRAPARRNSRSISSADAFPSSSRRYSQSSAARPLSQAPSQPHPQPYALLTITFQAWAREQHDEAFYRALTPYFVERRLLKGEVLWQRGDTSDGLYLIESGILKARYDFPQEDYEINEAMLAGTIAGELSFLSNAQRNTTAFAEIDCVLWALDRQCLARLRNDHHDVFNEFLQLLLSACSEEQEGLMSYLVSRLS